MLSILARYVRPINYVLNFLVVHVEYCWFDLRVLTPVSPPRKEEESIEGSSSPVNTLSFFVGLGGLLTDCHIPFGLFLLSVSAGGCVAILVVALLLGVIWASTGWTAYHHDGRWR